jgi:NADP-dependent 3-hydroxy acid dehydrogenase YdfG
MVNIKVIRASNAALQDSKYGSDLVGVFVGATSGIGMGTLKQFAKLTKSPKAYIAVRSIRAATPLLRELEASNPDGTFILHETEISLMKNVDTMCDEIKAKEKKVDIVFVSPGYLSFDNRNGTLSILPYLIVELTLTNSRLDRRN